MSKKFVPLADVRWFGSKPRITSRLFGAEIAFVLDETGPPPQEPVPQRPLRPWLRLLIADDPSASQFPSPPTPESYDELNWVDIYGETYNFHKKTLIVTWTAPFGAQSRTEFTFPMHERVWKFKDICTKFLQHLAGRYPAIENTLQKVGDFHIQPHPENFYCDEERGTKRILLFVGGVWLVFHCHTQTLSEMVEYLNPGFTNLPRLRPVYHDQMVLVDDWLKEGKLQNLPDDPSLPLHPPVKSTSP